MSETQSNQPETNQSKDRSGLSRQEKIVLSLSVILYISSFFCPAITTIKSEEASTYIGIKAAFLSLLVILYGFPCFFANPLFFVGIGLTFFKKAGIALLIYTAVIFLALSSFLVIGFEFPANEGGVGPPIVPKNFEIGYFMWITSMVLPAILSLLQLRKR